MSEAQPSQSATPFVGTGGADIDPEDAYALRHPRLVGFEHYPADMPRWLTPMFVVRLYESGRS